MFAETKLDNKNFWIFLYFTGFIVNVILGFAAFLFFILNIFDSQPYSLLEKIFNIGNILLLIMALVFLIFVYVAFILKRHNFFNYVFIGFLVFFTAKNIVHFPTSVLLVFPLFLINLNIFFDLYFKNKYSKKMSKKLGFD